MATTNIQLFNQSQNNSLGDPQYTNCEERKNGFLGRLARSIVINKAFFQFSVVCKSIADFIVGMGYNARDDEPTNNFTENFKKSILDLMNQVIVEKITGVREKETAYQKGDIVLDISLPLWAELECVVAGTTSNNNFVLPTITGVGQQITDGSVVWSLKAKRFTSPLNTPIPFNGSFTKINNTYYPIYKEIGLPMLNYRFCDGTNGTIDMRNRFQMCRNSVNDSNSSSGVDEVQIQRNNLPTETFDLNLTCNNWEKTLKGTFTTGNNLQGHTHGAGDRADGYPFLGGVSVRNLTGNSPNTGGESNAHTHQVTVSFDVTHKHSISGNVVLNSNSQQKISVVSRHYKLAYIQRIY